MPNLTYAQVHTLCEFYPHINTLAINSDAITPETLPISETMAWMHRPYEERIAESPYRDRILAEIAKHPGCQFTEFIDGPCF